MTETALSVGHRVRPGRSLWLRRLHSDSTGASPARPFDAQLAWRLSKRSVPAAIEAMLAQRGT